MPPLGRTVEAVIVDEDAVAPRGGQTVRAVRRRLERLSGAAVEVAVLTAGGLADVDPRLAAPLPGPGRLLLAVQGGGALFQVDAGGPRPLAGRPGSGDRLGPLLDELARCGIGPGLVLAPCPGQPLLRLLDEQLARRAHRRVPDVDADPAWTVVEPGRDPARLRVVESLFTLADGGFGTRGALEEGPPGSAPLVLACGVYTGTGAGQRLLPGPLWTVLRLDGGDDGRRVLDLRRGLLLREGTGRRPVRTVRFVSATRRGLMVLRAEAPPGRLAAGPALVSPPEATPVTGRHRGRSWARTVSSVRGGVAAVADDATADAGGLRTLERMAAYVADRDRPPTPHAAAATLAAARAAGFDRLLAEHRQAWARRWRDADVAIPDDLEAQQALRFALFQLWGSAPALGEAAVGARGLSGPGYSGHVFWDADVFVLPAVAAMNPRSARAILEYRIRRLPRARAAAAALGLAGARFPWESGLDGDDVTPLLVQANGRSVPVLTGAREEHVVSDVAWAACHYADWCGDPSFLAGPGGPLVLETARYWASRCRSDADGRVHVDGVIGPDEYHGPVDDNAYTNLLVRWHLRRAADLLADAADPSGEAARWRRLAAGLVDGYDPACGVHEQFAGYFGLEPLTVADLGVPPPVAADLLLGPHRTAKAQLVKQPDVLMAHHLVPDQMPAGSLPADLDFYGPRTAHGSSLSPAVTASLLARAGRPDEALRMLRVALRLDLDDLTGMTASGLHLATLGGVWQAVLFGFAGLRVRGGVLAVDPRLPSAWRSVVLRFRCLRARVTLRIGPETCTVEPDRALRLAPTGRRVAGGRSARFVRTDDGWRPAPD